MSFNKSKRGFTLVEVLLVSSLLLMIGVATTTPLRAGIRVFNRLNDVQQEQELAFLMEKMMHDLQSVVNCSMIPFTHSEQTLSFATLTRDTEGGNSPFALWPIQVGYRYDPDRKEVVREEKRNAFFGVNEVSHTEILASQIHLLKFHTESSGSKLPSKIVVTMEYGQKPHLETLQREMLIPGSYGQRE